MLNPESGPSLEGSGSLDPVCGMKVGGDSLYRHSYEGGEYLFCSDVCLGKFLKEPERYMNPALGRTEDRHDGGRPERIYPVSAVAAEHSPDDEVTDRCHNDIGSTFYCPMHPEGRQQGPGT